MKKCDICGAQSGDYNLCPECFEKMEEGRIVKCKDCGKWFYKAKGCTCGYDQDEDKGTSSNTNTQNITINNKYSPGCGRGCFTTILIGILIVLLVFGLKSCLEASEKDDPKNEEPNQEEEYKKQAPRIVEVTPREKLLELNKIDVKIYCPEDYEEIWIRFTFYDENGSVIDSRDGGKRNCSAGNTYIMTYQMDLEELLKAERYTCEIINYE